MTCICWPNADSLVIHVMDLLCICGCVLCLRSNGKVWQARDRWPLRRPRRSFLRFLYTLFSLQDPLLIAICAGRFRPTAIATAHSQAESPLLFYCVKLPTTSCNVCSNVLWHPIDSCGGNWWCCVDHCSLSTSPLLSSILPLNKADFFSANFITLASTLSCCMYEYQASYAFHDLVQLIHSNSTFWAIYHYNNNNSNNKVKCMMMTVTDEDGKLGVWQGDGVGGAEKE